MKPYPFVSFAYGFQIYFYFQKHFKIIFFNDYLLNCYSGKKNIPM